MTPDELLRHLEIEHPDIVVPAGTVVEDLPDVLAELHREQHSSGRTLQARAYGVGGQVIWPEDFEWQLGTEVETAVQLGQRRVVWWDGALWWRTYEEAGFDGYRTLRRRLACGALAQRMRAGEQRD